MVITTLRCYWLHGFRDVMASRLAGSGGYFTLKSPDRASKVGRQRVCPRLRAVNASSRRTNIYMHTSSPNILLRQEKKAVVEKKVQIKTSSPTRDPEPITFPFNQPVTRSSSTQSRRFRSLPTTTIRPDLERSKARGRDRVPKLSHITLV